MQKICLLSFLLIVVTVHQSEGLRCYACTYTTSSGEQDCITSPSSLPGQNIVQCSKKYCTIIRQESQDPRGKVDSFSRGCEEKPQYLNDVIEDTSSKFYYRSCSTDLCNSGDGLRTGSIVSSDGGAGENILVHGLRGNSIKNCINILLIFFLFIFTLRL